MVFQLTTSISLHLKSQVERSIDDLKTVSIVPYLTSVKYGDFQ